MKLTFQSFSAISSVFLSYIFGSSAQPVCRCLYGDSCWPSEMDFAGLAAHLTLPLIYPVPPATPCYSSSDTSGNCTEVIAGWYDGNWRANQSGAMQETNFETYVSPNETISACYFNTTLGIPCEQGSVSVVGVDARSVEDIQYGVNFAATHNLRLVIKNTGHDYFGRSDGRGSFVIWTHNLKNITFDRSFIPNGAPPSTATEIAITLGAGVQWHEAYDAIASHGRVLVGGISFDGSVGAAGGWLLGGGHSVLSHTYGLGVDNVIQFTVVLANGTHVTANAYTHPELFWALRGGGGGTFGVTTSVTYRTHASLPIIAASFSAIVNGSLVTPSFQDVFTEFVRLTPDLMDAGWTGYTSVSPVATTGQLQLSLFFAAVNVSLHQANASITPFFSYAQSLGPEVAVSASIFPVANFSEWYAAFQTLDGTQSGIPLELGSWLLPGDVLSANYTQVAEQLLALPMLNYYLLGGGAISRVDPSSTGLNPAWRKALVHTLGVMSWAEGTSAELIQSQRDDFLSKLATVRALAPESGAYFNEASLYEPNPKYTFFGDHYDKLKEIKGVYDPNDLFIVAEGINSDGWDRELTCRV